MRTLVTALAFGLLAFPETGEAQLRGKKIEQSCEEQLQKMTPSAAAQEAYRRCRQRERLPGRNPEAREDREKTVQSTAQE